MPPGFWNGRLVVRKSSWTQAGGEGVWTLEAVWLKPALTVHLRNCAAGTEERPTAPNPDEPGWEQMCQLFCLTAPEPQRHPVWDEIGDGSQVVVDSFRLTFAECAARGAAVGSTPAGSWGEPCGGSVLSGAPAHLTCETGSGVLTGR